MPFLSGPILDPPCKVDAVSNRRKVITSQQSSFTSIMIFLLWYGKVSLDWDKFELCDVNNVCMKGSIKGGGTLGNNTLIQ